MRVHRPPVHVGAWPVMSPGQIRTLAETAGYYRPVRTREGHLVPVPLTEEALNLLQGRFWNMVVSPDQPEEVYLPVGRPGKIIRSAVDAYLVGNRTPVPLPPARPRPLGPEPILRRMPDPYSSWLLRRGNLVTFEQSGYGPRTIYPAHPVLLRMIRDLPGGGALIVDDRVLLPGNPGTTEFLDWLPVTSRLRFSSRPTNFETLMQFGITDSSHGGFRLHSGRTREVGAVDPVVRRALAQALLEVGL